MGSMWILVLVAAFAALYVFRSRQKPSVEGTAKFDVPILQIANETDDDVLDILIEPHLEIYELSPGEVCDVYFLHMNDQTVPERTLTVAQRDDCVVVYSPGVYAPELWVDGRKLENLWAKKTL
ncbi:hypothetical protein shim_13760 [Shimia sp. SK013]|nr:hypothetical protein shim_13760 [Shimia sp. SK013]